MCVRGVRGWHVITVYTNNPAAFQNQVFSENRAWVRRPLKNQGLRGLFRSGFWKGVVPMPVGPNAIG